MFDFKKRLSLLVSVFLLWEGNGVGASEVAEPAAAGVGVARVCTCGDHDCAVAREYIPRGKGASGKWVDDITPKGDFRCVRIEDLGSPSLVCEMCERETVRYAHEMEHTGFGTLRMGCICAAYAEGILGPDGKIDTRAAKQREGYVVSRARWKTFLGEDARWGKTKKGHDIFRVGYRALPVKTDIIVVQGPRGGFAAYVLNKSTGSFTSVEGWYPTRLQAAQSAFDMAFPFQPPWL